MKKKADAAEAHDDRTSGLTSFESKLVNLLALIVVQERKQVEQIDLLSRAGFRPIEIASLLNTSSNTVSVALSNRKKKKKKE